MGVSKMNASLQSIEEEQGKSGLNWSSPAYINREKSVIVPGRSSYDILIKNYEVKKKSFFSFL